MDETREELTIISYLWIIQMDNLINEYKLGLRSYECLEKEVKRTNFENLFEDVNFSSDTNFNTILSSPDRKSEEPFKTKIHKYDLNKSNSTNLLSPNCLDIDPTGQFLLSGNNNGSIILFALDDKLKDNELFNKKVNYSKRAASEKEIEPIVQSSKNHYIKDHNKDGMRMVHSFETNRNKFRMYRKSDLKNTFPYSSNVPNLTSANRIIPSEEMEDETGSHISGISTMKWYGEDNGMFFTGSYDKIIKIWDTNEFKSVQDLPFEHKINQIDNVKNNYMNEVIVVASDDYYPRLIDLKSMNLGITVFGKSTSSNRRRNDEGMNSEILTCKMNPNNGNIICSGDAEGRVKLWDLRMTNKLLYELQREQSNTGNANSKINTKAHLQACTDLCWNEVGSKLCSIGTDGRLYIWDPFLSDKTLINRPQLLGSIDLLRNRFKIRTSQRLIWFNDFVICNTDNGEVHIYETQQYKLWNKIEHHQSYNTSIISTGTNKKERVPTI
ncbi:Rad28p NDAI_0A05790 [Naumovozyma dairenensis CBS 421]|uniref:Uncharacterized protein n=1 Tax=Naumovozyma dairenensis (strain ATCC 10597 / BCRC 20456 / CBS 421 / NBRC 0211 / NRRL Y-12639) TaxID=1071378 RepID=G0W4J6_NAUDC|nr:hypothetical protein NDAI_0A05790 [Naumovozyma dairenensis CBS 421]CCD22734.1 hypothetical protein NDAI_0A05790 [Naumovozyma dairenensis CBS 421]